MKPHIKYLVILLAVILVVPQVALAAWWNPFSWGVWNRVFHFQQQAQKQEHQQQQNNQPQNFLSDVLPFFPAENWGVATPKKMDILNEGNIQGYEITLKTQIADQKNSQDFFNHYKDKLTAAGWTEDISAAADGILGGQRGYKKGSDRIVLNFTEKPGKITSKANEPEQWTCPCQMTYTIFTGKVEVGQCVKDSDCPTIYCIKAPCPQYKCVNRTCQVVEQPPVVGGDKDAHGCIGSAGYSWCEAKQKCIRSWEEKCQ